MAGEHALHETDAVSIERVGSEAAALLPVASTRALDKMVLQLFAWDVKRQPADAIDRLAPFHTVDIARPN